MNFPVDGTRYVISDKNTLADNFTNKKPADHFKGDKCVDGSFLKHTKSQVILLTIKCTLHSRQLTRMSDTTIVICWVPKDGSEFKPGRLASIP